MSFGLRFSLMLLALVLVGCASRESGWSKQSQGVSLSASEQNALRADAMGHWTRRADIDSLKSALSNFELIHGGNPKDLETLIYLTRGYYFLADAHLDDPELKKTNYEKASSYGEMAMATNDAFHASVSSGKTVEESLGALTAKEVPAIYWTAASLGKWAKAAGIATQLKYKTRIKAMIERVEKLQPDYFYAATDRFWGAYYAVAPSFAGGDLKKSKVHFDKSLKAAPEYLGTQVLMAEVYWTKKGDKKEFEKMLRAVLASNLDTHKEIGPENTMEKNKAEKLLEKMDDIF
ncbi:MAG TPA: TRAP transporter TatT component family protein [Bacteriovoracaceae bacterium]|nr:TRAP transporter TatT component family protein [Bacteriovoracaceae bacterium]